MCLKVRREGGGEGGREGGREGPSIRQVPLTSSKQGYLVSQYLGEGRGLFEGEGGGREGGREGGGWD